MNDHFNDDEIERIFDEQQNQNIEPDFEQLLMQLILNPNRLKTTRTSLADFNGNTFLISQRREGCIINPAGFLEEMESEEFFMLDDGTSACGIVICQNCGARVNEKSIRRCICGKTCCIRPGCAKYSVKRDEWYCCRAHKYLRIIGFSQR